MRSDGPGGVDQTLPVGPQARGPRFVAHVGTPTGPSWRDAGALLGDGLAAPLAEVRERAGTTSDAIAGALIFEQYAHRLVAPVVATAYEAGRHVVVGQARVEFRDGALGAVALPGPVGEGTGAPETVVADAVREHLVPVAEQVRRRTNAPRRVLHGAVAHAITTAFLHLSWPRDDPAHYAEPARHLIGLAGLAGLVSIGTGSVAGEEWMYAERRSCCLAFRTARHRASANPYCATCPVLPAPQRRAIFREAAGSYRRRRAQTRS